MRVKGASKGRYVSFGDLGERQAAAADVSEAPEEVVPLKPGDAPGTFSLLYESKDGRLCTFEDSRGHLTSVDSSRFA